MSDNEGLIKVMYVDDEPSLLKIGKTFLEKDDEITVETVESAKEAILLLQQGRYDVIISDYQMPEMNGIEFLKYVNTNYFEKIPFIIFTGKGREEIVIEAINNGAMFYLQKGGNLTSQFAELISKVKQAAYQKNLEYKFKTIQELALMMSTEDVELKQNLQLIIKGVKKLLDVDSCNILLLNEYTNELEYYLSDGVTTNGFKNMKIPMGKGLGGLVLSSNNGLIIKNYLASQIITHDFDEIMTKEGIVSVMAAPIQINNQKLGVIYVFSRTERDFKVEDLNTLLLLGNLSAIEIIKKKRKDKIAEERLHYREFIDSLNQIVFETDPAGIINIINRFAITCCGYSYDDILGKSIFTFIVDKERDRARNDFARALDKDSVQTVRKYTFKRKDGSTFSGMISFNVISKNDGMRGYIIDITKQEQLENALIETNKKLNLINSITRHDINNYLTTIMGCIDLIEMERVDSDVCDKVQVIKNTACKIANQIRHAKLYQEIGIKRPQWFSSGELINVCSKEYANLRFENNAQNVRIFADPLLKKITHNLVDNTARHGKTATMVSISYKTLPDGKIALIYEDDGIGIPETEKEIIFKYGFGQNTGLGLFLIREILNITNMEIRETGEFGKGVRFEIIIPKENYILE